MYHSGGAGKYREVPTVLFTTGRATRGTKSTQKLPVKDRKATEKLPDAPAVLPVLPVNRLLQSVF